MSNHPNATHRLRQVRELDLAVRAYRTQNLSGKELFRQWKAIRDASLALESVPGEGDRIPGDDSY